MLTLQKITKGIKFARSFSYPSVATNFNDIKVSFYTYLMI